METEPLSKRVRSSSPSTEERRTAIYDLPHALLCYIISFLPLRDAVRTGVLARSWKYIWMTNPNWDLSFLAFPRMRNKKQRFEDFVDRVIYMHAGSGIQSMKIWHTHYDGFSQRAQIWMQYLIDRHPLRVFDFNICYPVLPPSSLFNCTTLVTLRLCMYELSPIVPNNSRLPNLKILILEQAVFPSSSTFQRLIDGCPIVTTLVLKECLLTAQNEEIKISHGTLTDLSIINCRYYHNWMLRLMAVNLRRFIYEGVNLLLNMHSMCYLQSIMVARLDFEELVDFYLSKMNNGLAVHSGHNMCRLLSSFRRIQGLILGEWCIEYMSTIVGSLRISPLSNLRSLNLRIWPNSGHTSVVAFLVRSCPALLYLLITVCENSSPGLYYNEERQQHPAPTDIIVSEPFHRSLKKVEIKKFRAYDDEMKLLQYMLKTFLVLEELNVKFVTWINPPLMSQAKKKVRTFVRASRNVMVGFCQNLHILWNGF